MSAVLASIYFPARLNMFKEETDNLIISTYYFLLYLLYIEVNEGLGRNTLT